MHDMEKDKSSLSRVQTEPMNRRKLVAGLLGLFVIAMLVLHYVLISLDKTMSKFVVALMVIAAVIGMVLARKSRVNS